MANAATASIRMTIPARLDRLRWTPFHVRVVAKALTAVVAPVAVT